MQRTLEVGQPLANDAGNLDLSGLQLRRRSRTPQRDVSAVSSAIDEDSLNRRVLDRLIDG